MQSSKEVEEETERREVQNLASALKVDSLCKLVFVW